MNGRWRRFYVSDEITEEIDSLDCPKDEVFDGVYISTRNNPERVREALDELLNLYPWGKVYLVPSQKIDLLDEITTQHSILDEYLLFLSRYFPLFKTDGWDLPIKRNFAIWHAKDVGHQTILLLDDDIRFKDNFLTFRKMLHAVHQTAITGAYSIGEFDTSLTGSIAMQYGITRPVFFSGNCLGINLLKFKPFFPNIYNEDWLSILPAILRKEAALVGPVIQLPRRVTCVKDTAKHQEFGEIIADELYSRLEKAHKDNCFTDFLNLFLNTEHWENVLGDRVRWLSLLRERAKVEDLSSGDKETEVEILDAAIDSCGTLKPDDFIGFINKWKIEYSDWEKEI